MLTVLFGESADNFAHLMRFYAPNADRVLDVTFGAGTLVKKCPCPVVGLDNDPLSKASIIGDNRELVTVLPDEHFPVAVYDPPYLYGSQAMHMGPIGAKTWSNARSTWKQPMDLELSANAVATGLGHVVIPDGIVIVKIMDSRYKGRLISNHDVVIGAFECAGTFRLHDQIVYIRTVTSSFTNPKTAQSAHGYYLIFKRN